MDRSLPDFTDTEPVGFRSIEAHAPNPPQRHTHLQQVAAPCLDALEAAGC